MNKLLEVIEKPSTKSHPVVKEELGRSKIRVLQRVLLKWFIMMASTLPIASIFYQKNILTRLPVRYVLLKPSGVIPHLMRNLEWLK
jgi:hypothetical protein